MGPFMRQALALVGPESLVICLGRSRGLGGLAASTSHSQPRFSPSHLPALIHTPPPPPPSLVSSCVLCLYIWVPVLAFVCLTVL